MDITIIFKPEFFTIMLPPQWMFFQTPFMLASQHSYMRLMVRSGNFLSKVFFNPPLIVNHHIQWRFQNNPATLITHGALCDIDFRIHFRPYVGRRYGSPTHLISADNGTIPVFILTTIDYLLNLQRTCFFVKSNWGRPPLARIQALILSDYLLLARDGRAMGSRTPPFWLRTKRPSARR
jgi:hypothetical protein